MSDVYFDFSPYFFEDEASCYMLSSNLMMGPPYDAGVTTPRVYHTDQLTVLYMPDPLEKNMFYWSVKGAKGFKNGLAHDSYAAQQAAYKHIPDVVDDMTHIRWNQFIAAFHAFLYECFQP